jgi:O-antigen ligase
MDTIDNVVDSESTTHSRRASWFLLLCLAGLVISVFLIAIIQESQRQATRGIGPALPDPVYGAGVSPLCINVALQRVFDASGSVPDAKPGEAPTESAGQGLEEALNRISGAGFVWVRQTFPWAEIEPIPGQYDWAQWDALTEAVAEYPNGLRLIAVLDTAPGWAVGWKHPVDGSSVEKWDAAPPANPADLARFAAVFAERYGDRIDVYQVWDEPNLSSHWGGRDVNPAEYLALLQAAADALRAADADSQATIVLAGLAPTIETGPSNLSDVRYLRSLYDLGAAQYFDVVAGKPYGFDTDSYDRRLGEGVLNFSRLVLLRETMLANGDGDAALWASNWGWNALPTGWAGQPSIWGQTDETTQADRTLAALERARREWPWAGALCLENWQPDAPPDDARWGFALIGQDGQPRPVYRAIKSWASADAPPTNPPGYYSAGVTERLEDRSLSGRNATETVEQVSGVDDLTGSGVADFAGEWHFSELGADVSEAGGQSVTIPFEGTDFGLRVRRGGYRAFFYVTVDGEPTNALPQDENGAYLVLASPDGQPEVITVPVAQGLDEGRHLAHVAVERGWGQWPLVGWSVGWWPHADETGNQRLVTGLGVVALICGAGIFWSARRIQWRWAGSMLAAAWTGLSGATQTVIAAAITLTFWASAWLTWGQEHIAGAGGVVATIASATLFFVSPVFILSVLSLVLLALLVIVRLDLGLALVAFTAPFYLQSSAMFYRAFSVVEIAVLLCFISWLYHQMPRVRSRLKHRQATRFAIFQPLFLDWAVLVFVAVAFASVFIADVPGVAWRELRVVVLEPTLYYLMLRTTPLDRRLRWRIVDAFVLGGCVMASIGLYQYGFTSEIITAEAGLRRLKSVYGSPNNVGLYLGRVLPVLVAVTLFARQQQRRWLYGAGALIVGAAVLLSFSKGALLLGVPASLLALGLLAGGRWLWVALGVLGGAALVAIPVLRTPRFTSLFDLQSGTSFFRLNLWRSAVDMVRDHPWLGVGLDNFLYAYRGRYIRPVAWQEPDLSHPHNIVLDYWSRLGILGLATGLWIQAAFWRLALPLRRLSNLDERALAMGLMASMVDFLFHGLVDNSFFLVDLAFAFCLTLALVVQLAETERTL